MSTETVQKRKISVSKTRGSKADTLKVPSFPQVNLLPSGIVEGRALKRVRFTAGVTVAASFVVVGLMYAGAQIDSTSADEALVDARARTAKLMSEQARYVEVTAVRAERSTFLSAERQGMATEVNWSSYVGAIAATAPEDVTIAGLEASVSSVLGKASMTSDPLQGDPLGLVTFGGTSLTVPDVAQWVRDLEAIHGVVEARIKLVDLSVSEGDDTSYEIQGSVVLTEDAASKRLPKTGE